MTNVRLKPTLVTARAMRSRALPPVAPRAGLEHDRRDDYDEADHEHFAAQQPRGLLGDEDEARRGDRADRSEQRFASASSANGDWRECARD